MNKKYITQDSEERKRQPIASGVLDYFPAAIAAVAEHSFIGNEKHNPGEPLHWAIGKSMDHADCIARHLIERGEFEELTLGDKTYRVRHSAALAWRALALLQEELVAEGFDHGRGVVNETPAPDPNWIDSLTDILADARFDVRVSCGLDPASPDGDSSVYFIRDVKDISEIIPAEDIRAGAYLKNSQGVYEKWEHHANWPKGVYAFKYAIEWPKWRVVWFVENSLTVSFGTVTDIKQVEDRVRGYFEIDV